MRMGEEEVVVSGEEEVEMEMEMESEERRRNEVAPPRVALRILLVEADDSTRQIIAALLRKCSYKVSAVSDGLKAWETLKGRPHNIDLVLTEVELPSISGFALLTLIMEHDVCKNIPVIMMSSNDSISMVLKCMLKGAADFLIKPVRKNELRNLWQHVWRRQTLTGGGYVSQKIEASSENNAASNHSSDCYVYTQKNIECSEKGSDTQGLSQMKCGSTSNLSNSHMDKHGGCAKLDNESIMPESENEETSNRLGSEVAPFGEADDSTALRLKENACAKPMSQDEGAPAESNRGNANIASEIHGCNDELFEPSSGAIDLIGTFDNHNKCIAGNYTDGGTSKLEFDPHLELSLRRTCMSTSNYQGTDGRHMLNHSNGSAFSWYNSSKMLQPRLPILSSNCTKAKEDASETHELSSNQLSGHTNGTFPQHDATLSNSQENITSLLIGQSGQAELQFPSHQLGMIPVPGVRYDKICAGYGHLFPSMLHTQPGLPPVWSPKSTCQQDQSPLISSTSAQSNPEIHSSEIHSSEQGYHRSNETVNNSIHQADQAEHEENDLEPVEENRLGSSAAGQTTTSSLCNGAVDHINGVAYGNGSTRRDENATAPESLSESGHFIYDGSRGLDSSRSSQREAALTKFRLKRKDRCYEKKVRYHSRKRLAEQRPRVKGQFVRQLQTDPLVGNVDC
ncbi:two-component response regulator-like APRR9 isoform X2 [Quercus lobata]|uniref:two-component response regulator-like APRR9 isoform X2 n=1 Tax=Quercus lobata TaxID=97700 RepID=UPI0012445EC4|nr:two-component response regulator-like APRR9 isoform X2 [Quercus lobata]